MDFPILMLDFDGVLNSLNYARRPIRSRLSSVDVGLFIELQIKKIVNHAFPPDFAKEILAERDGVLADMQALRSP